MTADRVRVGGFLVAAVVAGSLFVPGAVAQPGRSASFGSCSDVAYLQAFDERFTAPITCDDLRHYRIGSGRVLRVIKDRSASMGPTAPTLARISNLVTRFNRAFARVGGLSIEDVTVLLTDKPETRAHAWTLNYGAHECAVTFFKQQERVPETQFLITFAHELFHCVQFSKWRDEEAVGPADWWIEATAEYFANLAVPGTSESDDFVQDFRSESGSTSLIDMSYEAVVFFCWLGQHQGPGAIRSFIDQMATTDGRAAQLAAIQRVVRKDRWIAFVQDIVEASIAYPDGRRLNVFPPHVEIIEVTGIPRQTIPLPSEPYVVKIRGVRFAAGHSYALSQQAAPPDLAMRWHPHSADTPGGAWQTMPATVPACDRLRGYYAVWGTTASHNGGRVVATATTCSPAGVWDMTPASLARHVPHLETHGSCTAHGGTVRLTFNNDRNAGGRSTGLYSARDVTYECHHPGAGEDTVTTINGTAHMLWATPAGRVLTFGFLAQGSTVGTIHKVVTYTSDGRTEVTDEPLLSPIFLGPAFGGRYQLTGNRLHIDLPPGFPPDQFPDYSFDFVRVGPAPRP